MRSIGSVKDNRYHMSCEIPRYPDSLGELSKQTIEMFPAAGVDHDTIELADWARLQFHAGHRRC